MGERSELELCVESPKMSCGLNVCCCAAGLNSSESLYGICYLDPDGQNCCTISLRGLKSWFEQNWNRFPIFNLTICLSAIEVFYFLRKLLQLSDVRFEFS